MGIFKSSLNSSNQLDKIQMIQETCLLRKKLSNFLDIVKTEKSIFEKAVKEILAERN